MPKRTYLDYPVGAEKHGVITGFSTADTDFLLAVKNDLCLSMPVAVLSSLQNHYRLAELREPTADELIMLDIIYANAETETEYLISDFKTNDKKIAETFRDLTEKYSLLYGSEKGGVHASRILTAAGRYFSGCGFNGGQAVGDEKKIKFPVYCLIDCESIVSEKDKNRIFARKIEKRGSVLDAVLTDCKHAELYVSDLTDSLRAVPTFACDELSLIKCSEKDAITLGNIATSRGDFFKIIGRENKKGKFRFTAGQMSLAIDASLMMSFAHRYIEKTAEVIIPECVGNAGINSPKNGLFTINPTNSPFNAGEKLIITAAAYGIAHGISCEDVSVSCQIKLPTEFGAEKTVSLLLGIYRAEIELCIMSRDDFIRISGEFSSCDVLAVTTVQKSRQSKEAQGGLFVISPSSDDYESIRRCFNYILKFRASGHTSAVYEIWCGSEAAEAFPFAKEELRKAGKGFAVAADCIPNPAEGVSVTLLTDRIPSEAIE